MVVRLNDPPGSYAQPGDPPEYVHDECYQAFTAHRYAIGDRDAWNPFATRESAARVTPSDMTRWTTYEWVHPPTAKLIMWWFVRIDDLPVWSISCFFVRRGYRRQGVMIQLIFAALQTAKRARAPALEGYPIDTSAPKRTSNIFTGTAAAFACAGFKVIARRASARPIMRHDLKAIAR